MESVLADLGFVFSSSPSVEANPVMLLLEAGLVGESQSSWQHASQSTRLTFYPFLQQIDRFLPHSQVVAWSSLLLSLF